MCGTEDNSVLVFLHQKAKMRSIAAKLIQIQYIGRKLTVQQTSQKTRQFTNLSLSKGRECVTRFCTSIYFMIQTHLGL